MKRKLLGLSIGIALGISASIVIAADVANSYATDKLATATPIKHVVIIFSENVSFDHYFATYPKATNPAGEPVFIAKDNTPAVNGLNDKLLTENPNFTNKLNEKDAANPFRLDRSQASTADQGHAYTAEQYAYHNGAMDLFPKYTGKSNTGGIGAFNTKGQVMGYYDGNTVTALWNYAQNFAMNDNAYTDTYGPSTPGAFALIGGQTNGVDLVATTKKPFTKSVYSYYVNDGQGGFTLINDVDPAYDLCSKKSDQIMMQGKNIGDLLNAKQITWGGFMGGFRLDVNNANGTTGCKRSTNSDVVSSTVVDYIPHHNWFQYYKSTSNPNHVRPSNIMAIGSSLQVDGKTPDLANHQYDLTDFYASVKAGNYPAVSFLKASAFQDGHAGYSDPLDEQAFVVTVINFLQQQPDWKNTAVIVTWDDSDGWYDHAYANPTSPSFDPDADQLNGSGKCGSGKVLVGVNGKPVNGRCGPGTRIPFMVISPWAKVNYVSHSQISQSSVASFIEDNWLNGERLGGGSFDAKAGSIMDMFDFTGHGSVPILYLDPKTGKSLTAPASANTNKKVQNAKAS